MRAIGCTPIKYVQLLRIEAAKRRLERTADSVDQIACLAGYEDPAFFRRLFKRVTGVTPAVYRRKLQLPLRLQKTGPINIAGCRVISRFTCREQGFILSNKDMTGEGGS